MKKVLFVATVVKMHIEVFHLPYLEWFKKNGYETHVCAKNDYENIEECDIPFCDKYFNLPFERSPIKVKNWEVYKKLKNIIETNDYDIIHCHTPIGGVLTRIAAMNARKSNTRVFYTAHGFHFFKGAPIKNWLLYYPIEKFLAKYTDVLITINKEDYHRAKKFKTNDVIYIPGVGINLSEFQNISVDKDNKRKRLLLPNNSIVLLSVGELNSNKNHEIIIRALAKLRNQNLYYVICGEGQLLDKLLELTITLGIEKNVKFLGYRKDINELCSIADIFAFPSKREGLGIAALEAMAAGLPLITSNVHGIVDYSVNGVSGYNCNPDDVNAFADAINNLIKKPQLRNEFKKNNLQKVKEFSSDITMTKMQNIYRNK